MVIRCPPGRQRRTFSRSTIKAEDLAGDIHRGTIKSSEAGRSPRRSRCHTIESPVWLSESFGWVKSSISFFRINTTYTIRLQKSFALQPMYHRIRSGNYLRHHELWHDFDGRTNEPDDAMGEEYQVNRNPIDD